MVKIKHALLVSLASLTLFGLNSEEKVHADDNSNAEQSKNTNQPATYSEASTILSNTSKSLDDKQNQLKDLEKTKSDLQNKVNQDQGIVNKEVKDAMDSDKASDLEHLIISSTNDKDKAIEKIQSLKLLNVKGNDDLNKDKSDLDNTNKQIDTLNNDIKNLSKDKDDQTNQANKLKEQENAAQQSSNQSSSSSSSSSSSLTSSSSSSSSSVQTEELKTSHAPTTFTQTSGISKYDPANYGMSSGSTNGWSGHWYSGTDSAGQCTELVSSLIYKIYGLDVKNSDGRHMAQKYAALENSSTTSTPTAGSIVSMDSSSPSGHTAVVQEVYADGAILVVEQNTPWSGNISGKPYTWNSRVISKSSYQSYNAEFYIPKATAHLAN